MAIVHCPACGHRMSSLAGTCPSCHEPLRRISDEEREKLAARRRRHQIYQARNVTYLAMTLVIGGLLLWWISPPRGLQPPVGAVPTVLMAAGVVGYLAGWARMLWLRSASGRRSDRGVT